MLCDSGQSMDIFTFEALSDNETNFAEEATIHCLDVAHLSEASSEPTVDHKIVPYAEIDRWVASLPCTFQKNIYAPESASSQTRPSLRLIALEDMKQSDRSSWRKVPLGIPKEVYESIITGFEISPFFLPTFLNPDAIHFKHHQHLKETDPCFQHIFRTYTTPRGCFCLGLTYRPSAMQITALLSGLHKDEIQELFTIIRSCKMQVGAPMLIPTLLAGFTLNYIRTRLYHCHQIEKKVCGAIGLAPTVFDLSFREPLIDDGLQLSQSLTTIFGKLAKYDQHCGRLLNLLHFLDESSQLCLEATPEANKIKAGEATALIRTLITRLICTTQSSKEWTKFLYRTVQGYFQTVYSLIAQRDNLLNKQVAEASLRLAEATRTDNLAMKVIAEDSRVIAEESKTLAVKSLHKNNTMRWTAVVTMLFLPATFIATLFSTTFFNFQAEDGPVVSRWIWLYVLVTAIMTTAIQGIWFLDSRNNEKTGKSKSEA